MPEAHWPLVLLGVFRALRAGGVPLGVPDYLDVIAALRQGYPWSEPGAATPGRSDLRRLCKMLWARDDAEARLVNELFDRLPPASRRYWQDLEMVAPSPAAAGVVTGDEGAVAPDGGSVGRPPSKTSGPAVASARVSFTSRRGEDGLELPRLSGMRGLGDQTYALDPETVLSPRALAVLFRRFRTRIRAGARTELDLAGTIQERCRRGVTDGVVFRSPVVGRAPMIILADSSTSMAPWRAFLSALAEALALSRLASVRLGYFGNVPDDLVYASPDLVGAMPLDDLLARMPSAPVLLISDAGAARGTIHAGRVGASLRVLDRLAGERRRLAWLNPMPRPRWSGTSAGAIASRSRGTAFLVLDRRGQNLLRAIDILRGTRQAMG